MANGNGHVSISWPMLGMFGAFIAAVITGAIQLGGVQTHVIINTDRLNILETRERDHLIAITQTTARQIVNENRIKSIEDHDIKTRENETTIVERLAAIAAANVLMTERITRIEAREK